MNLRRVPGRDERADSSDGVIVGFLECPRCGASYVYIRRDDGSTAPGVR
jgi:uncharacterized C2H2 Zn-finger protein